jgi:2-dehydro-3-deoxygluconokinase
MELPDVVCLGETMILVTPTEPSALEDAQLFYLTVGGAESTVAMYLAEFGHNTAWTSVVGTDPLGTRLIQTLAAQGVDTSYVVFTDDAPTGVYFKNPGEASTSVHYYRKGSAASTMAVGFLEALPLATAHLVHTSGITAGLSVSCRDLMLAIPGQLRGTPTKLSFDVNYRPGVWSVREAAEVLLGIARQADYVFVGLDEAAVLWQTTTPQSIYDLIGPVGKVIVKDGAVGATEFSVDGEFFVPAPKIHVVEEVGAGDAFAAGYLTVQLTGGTSLDSLQSGHRLAARTLQSTSDFVPRERV